MTRPEHERVQTSLSLLRDAANQLKRLCDALEGYDGQPAGAELVRHAILTAQHTANLSLHIAKLVQENAEAVERKMAS